MSKRTPKPEREAAEADGLNKVEPTAAAIVPVTSNSETLGQAGVVPPKDAVAPMPLDTIEAQLRQRYLSVVYTHKTHEKDSDLCTASSGQLKLALIVTTTITAGGAIVAVVGDGHIAKAITAVISVVSALVSAIAKGMDLDARAQAHKSAALGMLALRQAYESLLLDLHEKAITRDQACKRRDQLFAKEMAIYTEGPRTTAKGYALAHKALKKGQEYTSTAEEIDAHLPLALRKVTRK